MRVFFHHQFRRVLSSFLIITLLLSLFPSVTAGLAYGSSSAAQPAGDEAINMTVAEATYQQVRQSLEKTRQYYLQHPPSYRGSEQPGSSSDFWTFLAMWGAGLHLKNDVDWKNGSPWDEGTYWHSGRDRLATGTEYAGSIIGSILLEQDPRSFGARHKLNLVEDLAKRQQADGSFSNNYLEHLWSMLALDVAGADYNRQGAVRHLLTHQTEEGFFPWGLDGTGWTLIVLSNHLDIPEAKQAMDKTVRALHGNLRNNGELDGQTEGENANSMAAAISGLVAAGENLLGEKWTKNNNNIVKVFLDRYQLPDGSFKWLKTDAGPNGIATYQGAIALGDVMAGKSVFQRLRQYVEEVLDRTVSVTFRVEGVSRTIYPRQTVRVLPDAQGETVKEITVLNVLQTALDSAGISYQVNGGYISSIAGESGGQFGVWDGWMYLVNGEAPSVGVSEYKVKQNDEIVVYYGNVGDIFEGSGVAEKPDQLTFVPLIGITPSQPVEGNSVQVKVQGKYNVYDAGFNKIREGVTANIAQAAVVWNGKTYLTNAEGVATIPAGEVKKGTAVLKVSKDVEQSYPRLLRTERTVEVAGRSAGGGGGGAPGLGTVTFSVHKGSLGGYIVSPKSVTLQSGDTPYSLLIRELPGQVETTGSGDSLYVRGIAGLKEFDHGPQSGWVYFVNGTNPNLSAGVYKLHAGDVVEWKYATNSGQGGGGGGFGGGGTGAQNNTGESGEWKEALEKGLDYIAGKNGPLSEWEAFALARAGRPVPEAFLPSVISLIKENDGRFRKTTDYARLILVLKALGQHPGNIAGFDLIERMMQNSDMTSQGVNGPAFALIALNSAGYAVPEGAKWTRDQLIEWILQQQNEDGGFALDKSGGMASDVDVTALVLQGLAKDRHWEDVREATERALDWLSERQLDNGGFRNADNEESSESTSQVLIALTSLGIDPLDARFVKNNGNLLENLLSYAEEDGRFAHVRGEGGNDVATEQAVLALIAYQRFINRQPAVYILAGDDPASVLTGYLDEGAISPWAKEAVAKARTYGLMQGVSKDEPRFEPQRYLTRAELAALLANWRGIKELPPETVKFRDVEPRHWYYQPVSAVLAQGWMVGTGERTFSPDVFITREQLAVVIARLLSEEHLPSAEPDAEIPDLQNASPWAVEPIGYVYSRQLMVGDKDGFHPKQPLTREMAAVVMVRIYEKLNGQK